MACGSKQEEAAATPTPEDVAGEYSFTESVNYNGASFETPWTLELNADGTYHLTSEGAVACDISGDFTVDDATTVTTGVPTETDFTILADFFEDDYSCKWTLDVDAKTATPVNYSGATEGASDAADATGLAADFENVAYASTSDSQVCNIYLPKEGENFPVIVLVHGGGFKFGDQTMELIQPVIAAGVENGYAVVSVDYRKSGEAQFPAALADVKAAVRFVKANASEYGFDADNVVIWGESAGAYLSLMTALTPEVTDLNGDVTDNLDYDSSVKALVDFYGPVEFYTMKEEYEAMGNNDAGDGAFESDFVGVADIYADKDACDKTYWETYKSQIPADFSLGAWIQVGDENDTNVPYTQSVNFSERLQSVSGVTVSFEQIAGAGHEDDAFYTDENLAKVFDFLADYVK
jgi:acetyl esterase/lipase